MNTQNTPVHVRLWHRDFWLLAISNMLLSVAVYMLIPTLPLWLAADQNFSPLEVGLSMGVFAAGLFLFGAFCSWLVQRYRRNLVCVWSVVFMAAAVSILYYADCLHSQFVGFWVILLQRLLLGAMFGLAQMVLSSTLIIDVCESHQRTEANHSAAWFSRFALSLGPFAGLLLSRHLGFGAVLLGSIGCAAAAAVLILVVDFPFRTPSDTLRVVSLDRFFLTGSMPVFLNLLLISVSVGMLLALPLSEHFYVLIMVGFLLALLAQRFVFRDAELKSEVVSGLILLLAVQLMAYTHPLPVVWYVGPVLLGLSVGIICSRFLLFFIKLSRHCQRGTSQSTCFLGWESGLALGLGLGYALFPSDADALLLSSLALAVVSLLLYNCYTHPWFLRHKNR